MSLPNKTRCGFAAIIGAPNAGKSTLLNTLLGQKLAIVSPKPQTTRTRILGITVVGKAQIGLLDTPGIFDPKEKLDRAMVGAAWQALDEANCILLMVDAARGYDLKTQKIVAQLQKQERKAVLALNKIDQTAKPDILPLTQELSATGLFTDIFMISAKTGDGVATLKKHIAAAMPEGEWMFDPELVTDMPSSLVACEITREQLYLQLSQELPYAAAVIPTAWEDRKDGSVRIEQKIVVARDGQKAIVIGKGGAQLKKIGSEARGELEKFFRRKVHLFLNVAVEPSWREQRGYYQMLGMTGK
ncbi:MAG: GTPase Era [Alphaproteobacteria bacterium]